MITCKPTSSGPLTYTVEHPVGSLPEFLCFTTFGNISSRWNRNNWRKKVDTHKVFFITNDLVPCRNRLEHHRRSPAAHASTEEMMCWPLPMSHYKLSNLLECCKLGCSNQLKAKKYRQTLWWAMQKFDPKILFFFNHYLKGFQYFTTSYPTS